MSTLRDRTAALRQSGHHEIGRDIRALERHLASLRSIQTEIGHHPHVIVMGPGRRGRDALDSVGAQHELGELIWSYETAIEQLAGDHLQAEIAACTSQLFTLHGPARAEHRRYLRDLIETRRAA